jgi:hypothetical protein
MLRSSNALVAAIFLSLIAIPFASHRLAAAEKASPAAKKPVATKAAYALTAAKPSPEKAAATVAKLRELRDHLGRALSVVCDLFSGNEAELLSNNKAALLSGNSAAILSGNKPAILSGNTTPILSGNSLSVLSNLKIEIHIENSGNGAGLAPKVTRPAIKPTAPFSPSDTIRTVPGPRPGPR